MKKDISFIWIIIQQKIFDKFKKIFINILYLVIFKPKKSVRIKIDILNKGVGACILQQNKKKKLSDSIYIKKDNFGRVQL